MKCALAVLGLLMLSAAGYGAPLLVESAGIRYQQWTLNPESGPGSEATVRLLSAPLTIRFSSWRETDVALWLEGGAASWNPDDGIQEKEGVTSPGDVRVQMRRRFRERLLVKVGINLPTGASRMSAAEFEVARRLGNPLLGFSVKEPGQGWGGNVAAAWGGYLSAETAWSAGASIGGSLGYPLLEGEGDFRPGSELAISVGLDRRPHEDLRMALDATWRFFGRDRLDGTDVYAESDQLEIDAQLGVATRSALSASHVLVILKGDDTVLLPVGTTLREVRARSGPSVRVTSTAAWTASDAWRVGAAGSVAFESENDRPREEGWAATLGPVAEYAPPFGGRFDVRVTFGTGRLEGGVDEPEYSLSGFATTFFYRLVPEESP
jgi:hypothetical protein